MLGLCFAAVFICYIDRVNISVAALAMQERFGWSETTKGLVLSSFFVGYLLLQIPSGHLANRIGGKLVLGIAVIWWSVCTLITPWAAAASLPLLITARISMGLGEAATFPACYNLFMYWAPKAERSRWVALLLSAIPLGTLFALSASGFLIAHFGWASVFYAYGAVGLVWALIWFAWIHGAPATHPGISTAERELIARGDSSPDGADQSVLGVTAVPWSLLLSKPAVWALVVNHFCSNWALYMMLTWLPSYFRDAQGLSITSAGLYSAAPWFTMFVMINVAGWSADRLISAGMSLTTVRKTMQVVGLVGSAGFLMLARDVSDAATAMILLCGALGTLAFTWAGYTPNHLDIAPRYADVLMGLTNTAGTIPGIVGVAVTGWLVDTSGTFGSAFALAAGINLFGALVWLIFATGKRII